MEIILLILSYVVPVKSKVKILQNIVAFSEYTNFICLGMWSREDLMDFFDQFQSCT